MRMFLRFLGFKGRKREWNSICSEHSMWTGIFCSVVKNIKVIFKPLNIMDVVPFLVDVISVYRALSNLQLLVIRYLLS